jgi:hypothetical protein
MVVFEFIVSQAKCLLTVVFYSMEELMVCGGQAVEKTVR